MYETKIKILIIKLCYICSNIVGNIIKVFRGNKKNNINNIKKIIFNRKDRIGDAIITKPLLILFSKYIHEELKLDINLEIECSKYNSFVFNDLPNNFKVIIKDINLNNPKNLSYFQIIKSYFNRWVGSIKKLNHKNNKKKHTTYVDLIGDYSNILNYLNKNYFFISCNLGLYNNILDFSLNYVYGNSNKNLINSYIKLLCNFFDIPDFKNYVYNNLAFFLNDYNHSENKNGILIFIGNKEYRNLNIDKWIEIINLLSLKWYNKKIVVIDDNFNSNYIKIKDQPFRENVELIENKFSLQELKKYASQFQLLIGIDGGGFNYIRTVTNSMTIYTIGNYNVWNIFIGKNKYEEKNIGSYSSCCVTIGNKKFGYIYKRSIYLPSYDMEAKGEKFNNIPFVIDNVSDYFLKK